ncbi:MAG: hypothetical protein LBU70_02255 [Chitinispirillales bacterium]|jgi:hypothetical protein|nr:hypothetical protein [Chitinispirillales bacterium]
MKKRFFLVLGVFLALSLLFAIACNSKSDGSSAAAPAVEEVASAVVENVPVVDMDSVQVAVIDEVLPEFDEIEIMPDTATAVPDYDDWLLDKAGGVADAMAENLPGNAVEEDGEIDDATFFGWLSSLELVDFNADDYVLPYGIDKRRFMERYQELSDEGLVITGVTVGRLIGRVMGDGDGEGMSDELFDWFESLPDANDVTISNIILPNGMRADVFMERYQKLQERFSKPDSIGR